MSGARAIVASLAGTAALLACGRASAPGTSYAEGEAMTITVESSAFAPSGSIPRRFTADGEDLSPPLSWSGIPEGARELALICDDPDAPTETPWVHWVAYGLGPDMEGLAEGIEPVEAPPALRGGVQGVNSWKTVGYRGPAPPKGHGVHHYHFRVYALDAPLNLGAGADKDAVLCAMEGRVVAKGELVGVYSR